MLTKKKKILSKYHVIPYLKIFYKKFYLYSPNRVKYLKIKKKSMYMKINSKANHLESKKKTSRCCHYGLDIIFVVKSLRKNVDKKSKVFVKIPCNSLPKKIL